MEMFHENVLFFWNSQIELAHLLMKNNNKDGMGTMGYQVQ